MRIFYIVLGALLILGGLPLFWTPVPVGAILIVIGLALIVANSHTAREWVHERRERNPGLDRWMNKAEDYTPPPFKRILHKTAAGEDQGEE
ncbi:hypothetical protein FKB34_03110 [Glycocaulis profundi]|nr:hypothetical protein FKB34_03110 [Glycocaulis profundi]